MQDGGCSGIIVEGVPGSGKSTLIQQLRFERGFVDREQTSTFIYGEEITQRVLEPAYNQGKLNAHDHIRHLRSLLEPLQRYYAILDARGWGTSSKHQYVYLFERFHLTHVVYYSYVKWADVQSIDNKLSRLSAKILILTATPQVLRERIFEERNSRWLSYIKRYGSNREEILAHYRRRQSQFLSVAEKTSLPVKIVDTSETEPSDLAQLTTDYWLF